MVAAKDIADRAMLEAIYDCGGTGEFHWSMRWDVEARFPAMPEKVVRAKFYQLMKRGLADGCPCGCRGDWRVTEAGAALIERPYIAEPAYRGTFQWLGNANAQSVRREDVKE